MVLGQKSPEKSRWTKATRTNAPRNNLRHPINCPPISKHIQGLDIFIKLVDPSRNRLASTAYFTMVSSVFCTHGYVLTSESMLSANFFEGGAVKC